MRKILIGYIFLAIILGVLTGIFVHNYNQGILEQATLTEVQNANKFIEKQTNIIQTVAEKEKTTPTTKVVFETMFLGCSHEEIVKSDIEKEDINQNEEFFKNKYESSGWEIKNFSSEEVSLYKEEIGICNKHYVVRENNNYVTVYILDMEGNETLKEVTDICTTYLPEEDLRLLKNGIKVNGDKELARILSDYE